MKHLSPAIAQADATPLRARDQRITPRGLSRDQASAYIGVSVSTFDKLVEAGLMPAPRLLQSRRVWDLLELDLAFSELPHAGASPRPQTQADSALEDWN